MRGVGSVGNGTLDINCDPTERVNEPYETAEINARVVFRLDSEIARDRSFRQLWTTNCVRDIDPLRSEPGI
jgi:hypothetical protein